MEIAGLGARLEVVEPKELRSALAAIAVELAGVYRASNHMDFRLPITPA